MSPAQGLSMNLKYVLLAGTLAVTAGPAFAQSPTADAGGATRKIANQFICEFDSSVSRSGIDREVGKAVGRSLGQVLHTYKRTIRGFAVRMPAMANRSPVAELRANNPKIKGCEQDQEVKAFLKPPGGGGGTPPAEVTDWGVTRVGGPSAPASGRKAWVIDTGVDLDHPDLVVDAASSATFVGGSPDDENGHGTHVAGTIGAIDNAIGVRGVAPGATIVSVRVLNRQGRGTNSGVIAGVEYVADNASPGDVANMSLGGGVSTALDNAVIAAAGQGIYFTLAAGNESDNANNHSPARANGNNIFTVAAFSSSGAFASFSNYGKPPVDYAAPGVSIKSTYKNGGYATLSGTSMAAPHVAGILMTGAAGNVGSAGNISGPGGPYPEAHE
jgi:subtilisin family serine protease